jgi:hypothetical protein
MIDIGVELLEKLKSRDDDHTDNLRCGGVWCGMSMQKNGKYCMHKRHGRNIYTRYREEKGVVAIEVSVVVVIEGDSCVKKEESAAAELNRRETVQ